MDISVVSDEGQLPRLLPLMRAYCDFYNVAPDDAALLAMSRALVADPDREGVQFLATHDGEDLGFATVFWSWETSIAARVGVLNDLFVVPQERGRGVATALMGDAIATNMFMLGYAYQKGWVPLAEESLVRAIELNSVAVEFNKKAFLWGRRAAVDLARVDPQ